MALCRKNGRCFSTQTRASADDPLRGHYASTCSAFPKPLPESSTPRNEAVRVSDPVYKPAARLLKKAGALPSRRKELPVNPNRNKDEPLHFRNTAIANDVVLLGTAPSPKHPLLPATNVST